MYIVSYDISDDRLRRKIAKTLEGYGRRVQYSVFECKLTRAKCSEMYERLCQLMADKEDGNIRIYTLCAGCEKKLVTIGLDETQEYADEDDDIVII